MKVLETPLKDCFIIEPPVYEDERGYFSVIFDREQFHKQIPQAEQFVLDNQSRSLKGTVRGLHMQQGKYSQAKLVRVLDGRIMDVVVDVRPESPTYLKTYRTEISASSHKQIFVPRGFLHGFSVLSESAVVNYKCDNFYRPESESGVIYNDAELAIEWGLERTEPILSIKDVNLPTLAEYLATR